MEPKREIFQTDALTWLQEREPIAGASIITSLPDFSELPEFSVAAWKHWFAGAAALILSRTPDEGVAIFYQRDSKFEETWIDKAYLIQKAAEANEHELLWHKIICRAPAGNILFGRPAYSHLLCFSKKVRAPLEKSTADVVPQSGKVSWARGMGVSTCVLACQFVLTHTETRTIVDPFCGHGTVLAVANALGMDAIGIELSRKRAEKAQLLECRLENPERLWFREHDLLLDHGVKSL